MIVISIPFPIEKPCESLQETILWEGFHTVCECSGGVVAVYLSVYGCTVRSSIAAFRVADPGFKSRPEHPCSSSFSYISDSFGFDFVSSGQTLAAATNRSVVTRGGKFPLHEQWNLSMGENPNILINSVAQIAFNLL
jgi:hypothetical protein